MGADFNDLENEDPELAGKSLVESARKAEAVREAKKTPKEKAAEEGTPMTESVDDMDSLLPPGVTFGGIANPDIGRSMTKETRQTEQSGKDYLESVDGVDFWTILVPEPQWVIRDILRPGVGVFMGVQKAGKSTVVTDIAFAVTTGRITLGKFSVEQGSVLYMNYEDNMNDLRARARALGYDENTPFPNLHIQFDAPRQDAGGMEMIQTWCEKHPDRKLVIIDPFSRFRRRRRPDENGMDAYNLDYAVVGEIHSLAVKYGVSILIVHHEKKSKDGDWVLNASGSVAITAVASSIMQLSRGRGKSNAILKITGRGIKDKEYALIGDGLTWKCQGDAEGYEAAQSVISIKAILNKDGEMTIKEIADTLDMKPGTVRKTLNRNRSDHFYKSSDGKRWGTRTEPPK
jgi:hypothetical protein